MSLEKTAIEQLELQLLEAIKSSDILFLDQVLHDDLLCLAPNSTTITKAMDLASHKAGDMVVESLDYSIENIAIIGDTAISMVIYDTKGKMAGQPIEGRFKYIRTWKQFDDGIKVVAAACMKVEPV